MATVAGNNGAQPPPPGGGGGGKRGPPDLDDGGGGKRAAATKKPKGKPKVPLKAMRKVPAEIRDKTLFIKDKTNAVRGSIAMRTIVRNKDLFKRNDDGTEWRRRYRGTWFRPTCSPHSPGQETVG